MTKGNRSVTIPPQPTPRRTIDTSPPPPTPRKGRAPARRRLALLSVGLLATTAVAALAGATNAQVAPPGDAVVEVAGAPQDPFEGGPDGASFSPVSVSAQAMAPMDTTPATAATSTTSPPTAAPPTTHVHRSTSADATGSGAASTASSSSSPTTAPPATAAPSTTQPPPEPEPRPASEGYAYDDPRSTQVWLDLANCESGGNWAADTGNGYYGGLQFSLSSWHGVGGTGYPHEHSRDTQIEMGRRLQAEQGWDAWPHCAEKLGLR